MQTRQRSKVMPRTKKRPLERAPDISKYTGIKRFTLYKLAARGDLPCYKIGRSVWFRLDEVEAALEKMKRDTLKEQPERTMELVDPSTGLMECKVCGKHHFAIIQRPPEPAIHPNAWRCSSGCNMKGAAQINTDKPDGDNS